MANKKGCFEPYSSNSGVLSLMAKKGIISAMWVRKSGVLSQLAKSGGVLSRMAKKGMFSAMWL